MSAHHVASTPVLQRVLGSEGQLVLSVPPPLATCSCRLGEMKLRTRYTMKMPTW